LALDTFLRATQAAQSDLVQAVRKELAAHLYRRPHAGPHIDVGHDKSSSSNGGHRIHAHAHAHKASTRSFPALLSSDDGDDNESDGGDSVCAVAAGGGDGGDDGIEARASTRASTQPGEDRELTPAFCTAAAAAERALAHAVYAELEDQLTELLICLGQEAAKAGTIT
jgi:hypothetical protein